MAGLRAPMVNGLNCCRFAKKYYILCRSIDPPPPLLPESRWRRRAWAPHGKRFGLNCCCASQKSIGCAYFMQIGRSLLHPCRKADPPPALPWLDSSNQIGAPLPLLFAVERLTMMATRSAPPAHSQEGAKVGGATFRHNREPSHASSKPKPTSPACSAPSTVATLLAYASWTPSGRPLASLLFLDALNM